MEKVTFLADKNHRSLVFRSLALIRIARSLLSRVFRTLFLPSIFSSLRLFHFECEKYAIDAATPCDFACEISHGLSQLWHCESNGPFDRKKNGARNEGYPRFRLFRAALSQLTVVHSARSLLDLFYLLLYIYDYLFLEPF